MYCSCISYCDLGSVWSMPTLVYRISGCSTTLKQPHVHQLGVSAHSHSPHVFQAELLRSYCCFFPAGNGCNTYLFQHLYSNLYNKIYICSISSTKWWGMMKRHRCFAKLRECNIQSDTHNITCVLKQQKARSRMSFVLCRDTLSCGTENQSIQM